MQQRPIPHVETYAEGRAREAVERAETDAHTLTPEEAARLMDGAAALDQPYHQRRGTYVIEARVHGLPGYDFAPSRVVSRNVSSAQVAYRLKRMAMHSPQLSHIHAYPEVF